MEIIVVCVVAVATCTPVVKEKAASRLILFAADGKWQYTNTFFLFIYLFIIQPFLFRFYFFRISVANRWRKKIVVRDDFESAAVRNSLLEDTTRERVAAPRSN